MQAIIVEEPYKFIPPVYGNIWPDLIQLYLPRYLRKKYGIQSMESRHVERLQASLDAGYGVLIAPNHCRLCDPLTFSCITRKIKRNMHAMASWHLFKQDRFMRFMLRRMGAFSVYREGTDRQAIDTAVNILVDGKRPLVVFAEGAISRHNDVLMPMMDGTAFIARTAAKRREKLGVPGGIVVHPIAIRYFFRGDLEATVTPVLEEIESHFSWYPQHDKSIVQRLQQIGQALLSLKEIEYLGGARSGDFYQRVEGLIQEVLTDLERQWNVKDSGEGVVSRVKNLRTLIVPDMVKNNISAEERRRRWKQLAACYYVQQMSHYPRHYVRTGKNIPEHILETVERFEEDFTDQLRVHGPFHVVVEVGEAIPVDSRRDRAAQTDPVMAGIRSQLAEMLAALAKESPLV
jgi:1-acyl-sn-glycerol-3-phosphate acyltransferase